MGHKSKMSLSQKRAILAEISRGEKFPEEILKEHGINARPYKIIKQWQAQLDRYGDSMFPTKKRYPLEVRATVRFA